MSFIQNLSGLKEVRCLAYLVQAHTLLAVMADRTSPEHQLNLLRAYTFVLQIWQVLQLYWNLVHHSTLPMLMRLFPTQIILELKIECAFVRRISLQVAMAVACEISSETSKSQQLQPPPSAESKKGKDKGKGKKDVKMKDVSSHYIIISFSALYSSDNKNNSVSVPLTCKTSTAEERLGPLVLDQALPSSPKDWARYTCPEQARQIFRNNSNAHCINKHSITKQASLSVTVLSFMTIHYF